MRISKRIADAVAAKMGSPIMEKYENALINRQKFIDDYIESLLPDSLNNISDDLKPFISTSKSFCLRTEDARDSTWVNTSKSIPVRDNGYITVDRHTLNRLRDYKDSAYNIRQDYRQFVSSMTDTLVSLKTDKKCKEAIPECADFLDEIIKTEQTVTIVHTGQNDCIKLLNKYK